MEQFPWDISRGQERRSTWRSIGRQREITLRPHWCYSDIPQAIPGVGIPCGTVLLENSRRWNRCGD